MAYEDRPKPQNLTDNEMNDFSGRLAMQRKGSIRYYDGIIFNHINLRLDSVWSFMLEDKTFRHFKTLQEAQTGKMLHAI